MRRSMITSIDTVTQVSIKFPKKKKAQNNMGISREHNTKNTYENGYQYERYVIRRLVFLNLGFIEQISCTPLPANLYNLVSQNSGLSTYLKILR